MSRSPVTRYLSAVTATLTIAVLGLLFGVARAEVPAPAAPYGLVAFNANGVPGETLLERTTNYRRLYDAGVRAIRLDIAWAEVEPLSRPPRDYDFSRPDREIAAITGAGLRVIGIIDYSNPRYSTRGAFVNQTPLAGGLPPFAVASAQYFPPDNPADFAAYAHAVTEHYQGRGVIAWEIWNEENEGWRFWPPHEDPAGYATLLCAAHDAIRTSDPRTPILFGGLFFPALAGLPGTGAPDFLAQAYRAHPNLGRCADAIAYHPYAYTFTAPELDVPARGSVLAAADQMHAALAQAGDSKPLWITEVGWPTNNRSYGISEEKQAQYVARMEAATYAQGTPVLTWYTYGDYSDPTGGANQEASFGFFRADNSAKPAYGALRTFANVFAGAHFSRDLSGQLQLPLGRILQGGRGFALEYARPEATVTALWYANESAAEAQGPLPSGGAVNPTTLRMELPVAASRVDVVDYLGNRRTLAVTGGKLSLDVGPAPQYVVAPRTRRGRDAATNVRVGCRRRRARATVISHRGPSRVDSLATGRHLATRARSPLSAYLPARARTPLAVRRRIPSCSGPRHRHRQRARFTG